MLLRPPENRECWHILVNQLAILSLSSSTQVKISNIMRAIVLVLCCVAATLAAAPAPAPSGAGQPIQWGRPCTLTSNPSNRPYLGAGCTDCGSGTTARPTGPQACTFKPQTATVGQQFEIAYQSSTHHLYLSTSPCQYSGATEICPDASSNRVNANNPCTVTFKYPGTYYISDSASNPGDSADFCKNFGAQMQVTVTDPTPSRGSSRG